MRNMPTRSEHSGCWRRHKCNSLGKTRTRFAAIYKLLRKHRLQVMGSVFNSRAEVDKAYEQTAELMTRTIPHEASAQKLRPTLSNPAFASTMVSTSFVMAITGNTSTQVAPQNLKL